ncbi:hypothetical protein ACSYGO_15550 [Streptomyces krungchingensis]
MGAGRGRRLTACGVLLLALAGCTSGEHGQGAHRPTAPVPSSAPATPTAVAGPARPVEAAAKLGPADSALADLLVTADLPGENPRPPREAVVVVRRSNKGSRDFGWVSGDSYCLGHSYQGAHSITCGPYDDTGTPSTPGADHAPARAVARMEGFTDRIPQSQDTPDPYFYTLAVVLDDAGPFRLTGDDHRGVLHQARAVLDPDRAVTFVEWGYSGPEIPLHAEICSASSHRCLTDFD